MSYAFPRQTGDSDKTGMTLREWYAGLAFQAMITKCWWSTKDGKDPERYAGAAFEYADAMIKESEKHK